MIVYSCKQCGQEHRRPDAEAGSLIFCDCGQGNRVPWAPEEAVPAAADGAESSGPRPRFASRRPPKPRDPSVCLNHADTAAQQTCADCREAFCSDCVVTL